MRRQREKVVELSDISELGDDRGRHGTEPLVESIEQRFQRLKAEWKADCQYLSDPNKIMAHPAMRAIIAMGKDVTPIILRELQASVSLLVWALPEITGEADPVPSIVEGGMRKWDVRAQNLAWLQWGREKNLI